MGERITTVNIQPNLNKKEFIIDECLLFSIQAGVQTRNKNYPVYTHRNNLPEKDRTNYNPGESLKNEIHDFLKSYVLEINRIGVSEENHCNKIAELADHLTQKHNAILHQNRFRIGIAQKIINLFLKYMWAMGEINEPCHCPIDGIVKKLILERNNSIQLTDWTQLDSMDEYQLYITAIKEICNEKKQTIAQWELTNWARRK